MPKDPIKPLGPDPEGVPAEDWEERNIEYLRKLLDNKEAMEALENISKIDKKTWSLINVSIMDLKNFVMGGGISSLKSEISEQFHNLKMLMWENLYADFMPLIMEIMEIAYPLIQALIPVVQWLSDVLRPIIDGIVDTLEKMLGIHDWTKEEIIEFKRTVIKNQYDIHWKQIELMRKIGMITQEQYELMIKIYGLLDPWGGESEAPPKFGREWMYQEPGLPTKY